MNDALYFQSQLLWKTIQDIPADEIKDGFIKYRINGDSIRFDDELAVAKGSIDKPKICMQRFRELGGSGWCLNEISQSEDGIFSYVETDEYESIYAYQLLNMRPSLLKVLMLPYDYFIVFDGDDIVEILNENDESILYKGKI